MSIRIAFGGPWYTSKVDTRLLISILQLVVDGPRCEILAEQRLSPEMLITDDAMLDLCRNSLMARALETPLDWFVSVDADCSFIGQVPMLARVLAEHNRPDTAMVAAPVKCGNSDAYNVVVNDEQPGFDAERTRPAAPTHVARIGFGFVAFNLSWYKTNWPRVLVGSSNGGSRHELWDTFFQTLIAPAWINGKPGFRALTEDYTHCRRVRELGGRVICDPRLMVKHHVVRAGNPLAALE